MRHTIAMKVLATLLVLAVLGWACGQGTPAPIQAHVMHVYPWQTVDRPVTPGPTLQPRRYLHHGHVYPTSGLDRFTGVAPHAPRSPLHVAGGSLVNGAGQTVLLRGVNRAGTEYACIQGWGIFDGPNDAASVAAMAGWGVTVVRVPLNEDCWLGINTTSRFAGAAYRSAVAAYVQTLEAGGLYVILDLHWSNGGNVPATAQTLMADSDHAPAFWAGVATQFRSDPGVLFDLYNEPHDITWDCWLAGCSGYAGMQTLLNVVRATGATNVVMAGGLSWSYDLSGWLSHAPHDPTGNLVAGWHPYQTSWSQACQTAGVPQGLTCAESLATPLLGHVPIVATETGDQDCTTSFVDQLLPWLDSHGIGWTAWTWDAGYDCAKGPGLITDYVGDPTAYGSGVRRDLLRLTVPSSHPTETATPAATPSRTPVATVSPQASPSSTLVIPPAPTVTPTVSTDRATAVAAVATVQAQQTVLAGVRRLVG